VPAAKGYKTTQAFSPCTIGSSRDVLTSEA
jgi:hypothetical protein